MCIGKSGRDPSPCFCVRDMCVATYQASPHQNSKMAHKYVSQHWTSPCDLHMQIEVTVSCDIKMYTGHGVCRISL